MNLEGKKVLVVGLGKTGEALCDFLLRRRAEVKVSEKRRPEELQEKIRYWSQKGVKVEAGGHRLSSFLAADLIVTSPGVPPLAEFEAAEAKGIGLISELELAQEYLKGRMVGITGSNGKSTTATLAHKILKDAGRRVFLAGNIDTPLIHFAEASSEDGIYVTELSSFQLAHTKKFQAEIAVLLNVTPDHLDWHKSFEDYYHSKRKLISFLRKEGVAILNRDDPLAWKLAEGAKFQVFGFSRKKKVFKGCYLQDGWIMLADDGEQPLMRTSDVPLFGLHNLDNVMAAALVGHAMGVTASEIKKSVLAFKGLEHRLERVLTLRGVSFYNDSKATNVDASLQSILSFDGGIILILGGRDKGGDFTKLKEAVRKKVKRLLLIGEAKEKIRQALKNAVPMTEVSSLREAVESGFSEAKPGEVVLLAPGCTSFDLFQNFEERGKIFKQEVYSLQKRQEGEKE